MIEALKTLMITIIIVSGLEMLIPKGNMKNVTKSVMGLVTAAIVLSEITELFKALM